jgi:hypothetical protein
MKRSLNDEQHDLFLLLDIRLRCCLRCVLSLLHSDHLARFRIGVSWFGRLADEGTTDDAVEHESSSNEHHATIAILIQEKCVGK